MKVNDIELKDVEETPLATETEEEVPEMSEEQKEMIVSFLAHRYKSMLQHYRDYMIRKNLIIDDLKKEVEEKTSPFTTSERLFLITYKSEFIESLLKSIFKSDHQLSKLINHE